MSGIRTSTGDKDGVEKTPKLRKCEVCGDETAHMYTLADKRNGCLLCLHASLNNQAWHDMGKKPPRSVVSRLKFFKKGKS